MNRRPTISRAALLVAALLVGALASSCGGGGRGGGNPMTGLTPAFSGAANSGPGLSMSAGTVASDTFQVKINVIDIDDFFGAAFFVTFDPAIATFTPGASNPSGAVSFILGAGVTTRFEAVEVSPGVLDINAERVGAQFAGVDANGTQTLVTLTFKAIDETAAPSAIGFAPNVAATPREVQVCPSAGACSAVNDAGLGYTGGSLTVISN